MSYEVMNTYQPTTTLAAEGRIFIDLTRDEAHKIISSLVSALADADGNCVQIEVGLWNVWKGAQVAIGKRNSGIITSGTVADSGLCISKEA